MRLLRVLLLFLILSGCAVQNTEMKEYVRDSQPTASAEDAPLEISFLPPDGCEWIFSENGKTVYREVNGEYTIETRCFVTDSMEAALYVLSGSSVSGIIMKQADREECRLVWCSPDGDSQLICRGKIILQGEFCYSLCVRVKEGLGKKYNECINAVFSSFSLVEKDSEEAQVFSQNIAI